MKTNNKKKRVLVGMSGGVDSSLAALLLKKRGFDVVGATIKVWPRHKCAEYEKPKSCCSLSSIEDARHIARKIGIPHYVFDLYNVFKEEVIDYFCREYENGRTPNPCIVCNQKIKFGHLLSKAMELDCDYISTGHYADIGYDKDANRYFVREGRDRQKDQSYFLAFIPQNVLDRIIFPLSRITKSEARSLAKKYGLRVYNKKSSQEICFVTGHYSEYLGKNNNKETLQGNIINTDGEVLGRHKGIHRYTLGQRKGLGIAHKSALYVIGIDKKNNIITVGTKNEVSKKVFTVKDVTWGLIDKIDGPMHVMCKIRYMHKKAKALIEKLDGSRYKITFKEKQVIPAPGQAAVFYKKDRVAAAAWIDELIA